MIESLRHIWQQVAPHLPTDLLSRPPVVAGAAAAMALGILMLIWARPLGRALPALLGIGVGLVLGPAFGAMVGLDPLIGRLALAAVLGIIGLLAARGMWAVLLSALAGLVTGAGIVLHHLQWVPAGQFPQPQPPQTHNWQFVGLAAFDYSWNLVAVVAESNGTLLAAGVAAAMIVGLVLGVLMPTVAIILVASLLGAALVVAGWQALMLGAGGQPFPEAMGEPVVALSVIGALTLVGVILQSITARKARKAEKEQIEEPADGESTDGDKKDGGRD
jgi:hypothetical protein